MDDEDYDFLAEFKWHAEKKDGSYYAKSSEAGSMHRLLPGLKDKRILGDHKDGNTLNNQRENLRACTSRQNNCNRKSSKNSISKYLGVSWDSEKIRWVSHIKVNGKNKKLGRFRTELEAAIIYNIAARKYHGEFANPNKF